MFSGQEQPQHRPLSGGAGNLAMWYSYPPLHNIGQARSTTNTLYRLRLRISLGYIPSQSCSSAECAPIVTCGKERWQRHGFVSLLSTELSIPDGCLGAYAMCAGLVAVRLFCCTSQCPSTYPNLGSKPRIHVTNHIPTCALPCPVS